MEEYVTESISIQRFTAGLLTVFAVIALVLSTIGLYGVLAYAVSRRTHEIGVRLALGAQARQILTMVLSDGGKLVGLGLSLRLAGALAVSFLLQRFLYERRAQDPLTFLVVLVVLSLTTGAACYLPAQRATRVEPMVTLRYE